MACPNCGSWSVRADRSLGGRMVCGRCGSPIGGSAAQGRRSWFQSRGRKQAIPALSKLAAGWWGLIALGALGAGLAWLEPNQNRQDGPNLAGGSLTKICSSKPIGTTVLQALGVACLGLGPLISWFGSDLPLLTVPFR